MRDFNYDIKTLIKLIEKRPCIWNKNNDQYRDRMEKQSAWNEVCAVLEGAYYKMTKNEQSKICQLLQAKWQNVKDCYTRYIKKRVNQNSTKKYIYADCLRFLSKNVEKDDTESSISDSVSQDKELEEVESSDSEDGDAPQITLSYRNQDGQSNGIKSRKRKWIYEKNNNNNVNAELDEDEAFFISLIPTLKKFSEDDKLDFKMGVLGLIMDIKKRATESDHPLNEVNLGNCSPSNSLTSISLT